MSARASSWAMRQTARPTGAKFVLVILADCAAEPDYRSSLPISRLCSMSSQARSAVVANLERLQRRGLICDLLIEGPGDGEATVSCRLNAGTLG